jgi:hypothetical protein
MYPLNQILCTLAAKQGIFSTYGEVLCIAIASPLEVISFTKTNGMTKTHCTFFLISSMRGLLASCSYISASCCSLAFGRSHI